MKTDVASVVPKSRVDHFLSRAYRAGKGDEEMSKKETKDKNKIESEEHILNLSCWSENEESEEGATSNSSSNTTSFTSNCLLGGDNDIYSSLEGDSTSNGLRISKKPIPEDLKDPKYFERRRRNNMAAKKSRDARKLREDHILTRVSYLEQENAVLRTQAAMMREELRILQMYQIQKRQSNTNVSQSSFPSPQTLLPSPPDSLTSLPLSFTTSALPMNVSFNHFPHYQMQSPIQFLLGAGTLGSSLNSEILTPLEIPIQIPISVSSKYIKEKKI